jgi:hypothetical protein
MKLEWESKTEDKRTGFLQVYYSLNLSIIRKGLHWLNRLISNSFSPVFYPQIDFIDPERSRKSLRYNGFFWSAINLIVCQGPSGMTDKDASRLAGRF